MARQNPLDGQQEETAIDVSTVPDEWEFTTVTEEYPTKVVFDEFGDTFIGQYIGMENIKMDNGSFDVYLFTGRDGKRYSVSATNRLRTAMDKVAAMKWVRIRYVGDIQTGGENPMKDLQVDVRSK